MMANGGQKEHIEERTKKGAVVMREVWGIRKRNFGKDWARRIWPNPWIDWYGQWLVMVWSFGDGKKGRKWRGCRTGI